MKLAAPHVRILRHALGMDTPTSKPWRNHYVAGEGSTSMPLLNELLVSGLVDVRDNPGGSGYLFSATDAGRKVAVDLESPVEVALSKAQQDVADKVARYLWKADGCPEKDSEPTSVGRVWYEDRTVDVIKGLVALGFDIKPPAPAAARKVKP